MRLLARDGALRGGFPRARVRDRAQGVRRPLLPPGCVGSGRRAGPGAYFPNDVQYLFTVDIWAPTAFSVPATDEIADRARNILSHLH